MTRSSIGPRRPSPWLLALTCFVALLSGCEKRYLPLVAPQPMYVTQAPAQPEMNTESYARIDENPFQPVASSPLSTFSIDVDTASYANVRRFLRQGQRPPADAVRIEELVNYFPFTAPPPTGEHPVGVGLEVANAPWHPDHRLVRITLQAKDLPPGERPASNLVFLIDVSGSMNAPQKLPLVQESLRLLVDQLEARDRMSLVVYAGATGVVLPPTPCDQKKVIVEALEQLDAGGPTGGAAGIELAYRTAVQGFIPGGVNRVILATDGDFNVGPSSEGELTRLIEEKAQSGVFLTVLGVGMGNLKDSMLEKLADRGNGSYAYIDTMKEARKVFVEQIGGTLVTLAKDVKVQVEFNPAHAAAWRLIGYENRVMRAEDFKDDRKDAGEMGAGQTMTAFYEVVPAGRPVPGGTVDPLKYQSGGEQTAAASSGEMLTVKVRYKHPESMESRGLEAVATDGGASIESASADFRFGAGVVTFGMLLRNSPHKGTASWAQVLSLAESGVGEDRGGYRREFVELARAASQMR